MSSLLNYNVSSDLLTLKTKAKKKKKTPPEALGTV